jgi:hypothetical protein
LFLASGKLDRVHVLPVQEQLARATVRDVSVTELLDALAQHEGTVFEQLSDHLRSSRLREAQRFHALRRQGAGPAEQFQLMLGDLPLDAPPGWKTNNQSLASLSSLVLLAQDQRYVSCERDIAPITAAHSPRIRFCKLQPLSGRRHGWSCMLVQAMQRHVCCVHACRLANRLPQKVVRLVMHFHPVERANHAGGTGIA